MKKILLFLLVLCIAGLGVALYMIRPVSAPSTTQVPVAVVPEKPVVGASQMFVINPEKSEAKFEINEVLTGKPFHVVGTTKDVTGQMNISPSNLEASTVGTIKINARTLKTDSEMRNGAIGRRILHSEENEFITFTPNGSTGLPEKPEVGQEYTFQTTGTLTVSGVSKDVTFAVTAKAVSETEVDGVAKATIKYADFGLVIPKVPMVASVEDNVDLTFTFVAEKK